MVELRDVGLMQEKAIELFYSGLNCSQSVLSVYADFLDIDSQVAESISCGFGAGMGRLQDTCGAVTGAYMVLGVYCSKKIRDIDLQKEESYAMVQGFNKNFVAKYNTTNCKMLLNCDLNTEEGKSKFQSQDLKQTVCSSCIRDSIQIISQVLG